MVVSLVEVVWDVSVKPTRVEVVVFLYFVVVDSEVNVTGFKVDVVKTVPTNVIVEVVVVASSVDVLR
jgi:hypothetical protein